MMIEITAQNFEADVVRAEAPVLLDFYADWCMPCKMLATVIDEIAAETSDMQIGKVNIDRESELARRFEILSIPTLVVMSQGDEISRISGVQDKETILKMLAPSEHVRTTAKGDGKNA